MNIFISTTTFAEYDTRPLEILTKNGFQYYVNKNRRKFTKEEIMNVLRTNFYQGLLAGTEILDRDVLRSARSLKIISRIGSGVDNIDLQAAGEYGIKVFNTPNVLTDAVAELTIGLILSCLRSIVFSDHNIKKGFWQKPMGELLNGKTIGILGFGNIGYRVGCLCKAFHANVLYYDTCSKKVEGFKRTDLSHIFEVSDIITVHISSTDVLLGAEQLSALKKGVIIINTSRPTAIDEKALYTALQSGKVMAAGLDVFSKEPYSGELIKMSNVVLTPHIGSYAREARIKMEIAAVNNLVNNLANV